MELRPITVVKRRKRAFFARGVIKDYSTHASQLAETATHISHILVERTKTNDMKTAYMTLRSAIPLSEQALKQVGLVPVQYKDRNTIVVSTEDAELYRFRSKLTEYRTGPKDGKTYVPLEGLFGNIEGIALRSTEDKLGPTLKHLILQPGIRYKVDVRVLPRTDLDERRARFHLLTQEAVQRFRGKVLDTDTGRWVARIEVRGRDLQDLIEHWDDIEVDGVPLLKTSVDEMRSFTLDKVKELRSPSEDATGICIIDSGVDDNHVVLTLAHKGSRLFFRDLGHLSDTKGHGTKVAGIAVYGDMKDCLAKKTFLPELFFCSAKIIEPDDEGLDEMDDELLEKKLRRIVQHFKDDCRVFNLSVAFAESFDGHAIQDWVAEIDKLSREYDVLFVTCTGNIQTEDIEAYIARGMAYPKYLEQPEARLYPPGNAVNAISVGSIVHSTSLQTKRDGRRALASVLEPSPFSRTGLGIEDAIKPDVSEYGGNYFLDPDGRVSGDDPLMGIPTTAPGNQFTTSVGTSFATPRVSHLAGKLFNKFRGRSANLVRALVVNSALLPPTVGSRANDLVRHYGYGIPKADRALYSTFQRVTLLYEGQIMPDTCEVFAIPVPPDLFRGKGKKNISVTLAYDPEVDPLNSVQYCGIELEWKLAKKGTALEDVVRELDAELDNAEERVPKSIWWTSGALYGSRLRSRGTVQKDVFSWTRGSMPTELYVAVIARRKWSREDMPQKFALVVTLETTDDQVDIYNQVRNRTRVRPRVRLGVKQ